MIFVICVIMGQFSSHHRVISKILGLFEPSGVHFQAILAVILGSSWVILGSSWNDFGIILVASRPGVILGITFGSLWDYFGIMLGIMLGSLQDHSGVTFSQFVMNFYAFLYDFLIILGGCSGGLGG